ncbi:MAG TPA: branched-chain amino acid ABC transporter permease [Chthoniobacterales bacterium]|nr:branched-chain amino acid ABC transporter permease [Chthoniobacterales bacterium]
MSKARLLLGVSLAALLLFSLFGEALVENRYAYYYDILINIGINIILAVSLNLVNGYTGQFSLGHAGFMAVGAYAAASWSNHLDPFILNMLGGPQNGFATNLALLLSMSFGGLLAAIAGIVVGIPSLRLKGDYLAIVTLGFGEIIRTAILNTDFLGAARGLRVSGNYTNLFWTFGTAAIAIYVVLGMVNSTFGRGFLTVRDDEIAAEAMGINSTRYKVLAFVVGALFAGMAGALFGHFTLFLTPEGFNFFKSVDVVVMVILGGMGSTTGVILAAILLTILPEVLRALAHTDFITTSQTAIESVVKIHLPPLQGLLENRLILYSVLLIIMMLTRPQGLFGDLAGARKRVKSVSHGQS